MFIGRLTELATFNRLYQDRGSKLVVIYGRRRVGKSTLVEQFAKNKTFLRFEGLEGVRTTTQIMQFTRDVGKQLNDPILKQAKVHDWETIFDYLTQYFSQQKQKIIFFLDEFQWLAANQTRLVSIIKKYWDQYWSKQNILLILCGSVSSYMSKRVISSKALYGRINWELCLPSLGPRDALQLLQSKRSHDEIFQYLLIFGGIPKYLQEIDTDQSLAKNINRLCFVQNSLFANEYQRIFYSQFKEYQTYEKMMTVLEDAPLSLDKIAKKLHLSSGGGLKSYLDNLEKALFITSYVPYDKLQNSTLKKYKLTDEYLRFYFKYIAPHSKRIASNRKQNLFDQLVKSVWLPWLGFAFENFCLKNAEYIASLMGFDDTLLQWGPVFHRQDKHFQVDLVYLRSDNVVTLCEIKYRHAPISTNIIPEVEKKCDLIRLPRGYTLEKALISRFGPDNATRDAGYFHHLIEVNDFFS